MSRADSVRIDGPQRIYGRTWPTRDDFLALAPRRRVIPVVRPILADGLTPVGIYQRMCGQRPGTFILESADYITGWSRWSFIGVRSLAHLVMRDDVATWHGELPEGLMRSGRIDQVITDALTQLHTEALPGLPPLTGGLVGALGWDVTYCWEPTLRRAAPRDNDQPDAVMLLATDLIAIDHHTSSAWLISNAINMDGQESGAERAYDAAVARLDEMEKAVATGAGLTPLVQAGAGAGGAGAGGAGSAGQPYELRTSQADFEAAVRRSKEYIHDGDVFQVVISNRADVQVSADPLTIYRALRSINPSPYMYLVRLLGEEDGGQPLAVVGSSPETLVRIDPDTITTYPIAGSRPRGATVEEDTELARELLADPKEISEHIMLVDLARNDVAKVSEPGSVAVTTLKEIKRYSHIMHISSTVRGQRRADASAFDCLAATFPAGTLSGAPKPRAIEIIDELEPVRRGLYGGVIGYFDFADNADFAIAIRTAIIDGTRASVQAGAGLVAESDPHTEFIETRNKAASAMKAIEMASQLRNLGDTDG